MSSLSLFQLSGGFNAMVVSIGHVLALLDHSQQFRPPSLNKANKSTVNTPTNEMKTLETVNCFVFKIADVRPMTLAIRLCGFIPIYFLLFIKMYMVFFE